MPTDIKPHTSVNDNTAATVIWPRLHIVPYETVKVTSFVTQHVLGDMTLISEWLVIMITPFGKILKQPHFERERERETSFHASLVVNVSGTNLDYLT